jgi:hypothetical protein
MPRQLGDNAVEASGKYTYIISLFQLQRKTNYQQNREDQANSKGIKTPTKNGLG